jgi:hypothetical protein
MQTQLTAEFEASREGKEAQAILRSVDLLRFFDIIYITTQGGPGNASNTLNIYGFRVGFEFFNIGYASALMLTAPDGVTDEVA